MLSDLYRNHQTLTGTVRHLTYSSEHYKAPQPLTGLFRPSYDLFLSSNKGSILRFYDTGKINVLVPTPIVREAFQTKSREIWETVKKGGGAVLKKSKKIPSSK